MMLQYQDRHTDEMPPRMRDQNEIRCVGTIQHAGGAAKQCLEAHSSGPILKLGRLCNLQVLTTVVSYGQLLQRFTLMQRHGYQTHLLRYKEVLIWICG